MGLSSRYTLPEVEEYLKCATNVSHFIEKHAFKWIERRNKDHYTRNYSGNDEVKITGNQKLIIRELEERKINAFVTYRQSGSSSLICMYLAHFLSFNRGKRVIIGANTLMQANNLVDYISEILLSLPGVIQPESVKRSNGRILLDNGCEVIAQAVGKLGVRGYSADVLFIDDFMWAKYSDEFLKASLSSCNPDAQIIGVTGYGEHTEKLDIWGKIGGNIRYIHWFNDHRFNKNLRWEKTYLNEEEGMIYTQAYYNTPDIAHNYLKAISLIEDGFIIKSDWTDELVKHYDGYDDKRFIQHMLADFYFQAFGY